MADLWSDYTCGDDSGRILSLLARSGDTDCDHGSDRQCDQTWISRA